ncbi:MAG: YbgC/FadM family acyl-CoA thioesterase [Pseudomonadota bacterium]
MAADPHRFAVKVYWEDTDAGGIVYHAGYLRFAERARSEMLSEQGVDQWSLLEDEGLALAVREMTISFHSPARLGESLEVVTKITETRGASVWLDQQIHRGGTNLTGLILQIACVNRRGRAVRLPHSVREALG